MKRRTAPQTLDEFLNSLEAQDKTLADWARENGFRPKQVYSVASQQHTGAHGTARQIVKAMGLKPPPMRRQRVAAAGQHGAMQ
jgi:gp16 family phage-associated protein